MPEPTTPVEVFDTVRERALTMLQTAFMDSGRAFPTDEGTVTFIKTVLGVGVAAASEYYAQHPAALAFAGQPICQVCREPVATLQVGADPARDPDDTVVVTIAWPCGHLQP